MENKKISFFEALLPILILLPILYYNVKVFADDSTYGPNQIALLFCGFIAALLAMRRGIPFSELMDGITENIKSTAVALIILLFVGSIAGTWMLSGIVPAMIYYGLDFLSPNVFLFSTVLISIIVSLSTGSSWTTVATVGIALIGIGRTLGFSDGMIAGAIISGAYFGDKMSPLSDTTNLAPAMAGTDLFTHIKYMTITTFPTIIITLIVFIIFGFTVDTKPMGDTLVLQQGIKDVFTITPWLFLVPLVVILLLVKKVHPIIALMTGTILGAIFVFIFQKDLLLNMTGGNTDFGSNYKVILQSIFGDTSIPAENETLAKLLSAGGMSGMLNTIWLIITAMVFGGILEKAGSLRALTEPIMKIADSITGLVASTVATCLTFNVVAADQYLAVVVPGRMYKDVYKEKGFAPENLSRTLEDSGTVTSALIPINTCGAYHSGVLGVSVFDYAIYAIFNWLSPIMTILVAALGIKIKTIVRKNINK